MSEKQLIDTVQSISHVVRDLADEAVRTAAHSDRTSGMAEALHLAIIVLIQTHPNRDTLRIAWDAAVLAASDTMSALDKPASPAFDDAFRRGLAMLSAQIQSGR